jgi:tetratricopeptide (TPR) repeat protein
MKASLKIGYLIIFTLLIQGVSAQVLDEETGFIYVKAEYLYETGRYDEAISQYNQVITKDPKYKDALLHRGWAKYAMAAYKGAKMDAMQSIDLKGINADAAALLGRSFSAMQDENAAINSLTAAIALDNKNGQYYEWRAAIYEDDSQLLKACQDYEMAMNLGSASAEVKAKNLCGIKSKQRPVEVVQANTNPSSHNNDNNTNPNDLKEDEVLSDGKQDETNTNPPVNNEPNVDDVNVVDDSEPVVIDENVPKNDDSVNSFEVDEDLTIEISGQELGKRKIKEVPSILILADENGKVSINICVNKEGVVTTAEFNGTMSTIAKKSLVSLALRKAKEFEFAPGKYDSQCGIMVFKIKGS